jgi:hypothetical protein
MARFGLRMMPTFPSSSLKFRTVGFPQYGFKASMSDSAFLPVCNLKPAPGIRSLPRSLLLPFARFYAGGSLGSVSKTIQASACRCAGGFSSLPQGSSAPVQVMLSRSISAYTTPCASPTGTLRFRSIALIRSAFAVRERLGNPRDLPYFCCCSFHACHRPYSGGPLTSFVPLTPSAVPDFLDLGTSRQPANTVSASNIRRVLDFGAASVRFMLRPACLPSPPDWLRQDEVTCSSPRLLRYIVTPALDAVRYQTTLGVRLNGRTGNLPLSGLSPNQLSAASEAAPKTPSAQRKRDSLFLRTLASFATLREPNFKYVWLDFVSNFGFRASNFSLS